MIGVVVVDHNPFEAPRKTLLHAIDELSCVAFLGSLAGRCSSRPNNLSTSRAFGRATRVRVPFPAPISFLASRTRPGFLALSLKISLRSHCGLCPGRAPDPLPQR
jgi:hypothetical protein